MNNEVTSTSKGYSSLKRHYRDDQPAKMYKRRRLSPSSASRRQCQPSFVCAHRSHSRSITPLPRRRAQATDFRQLIERQNLHDIERESQCLGRGYCGKKHFSFVIAIKTYTQKKRSSLTHDEIALLMKATKSWVITPNWSWKSLTAVIHSLTVAGAFVSPIGMTSRTARYQARLLESLLEAVTAKSANPQSLDTLGVTNTLWAAARIVGHGVKLTPLFEETVAALLPFLIDHCDQFTSQGVYNLLWALAKLVEKGMKLTPLISEAVVALSPFAGNHRPYLLAQELSAKLWAMVTLLDFGLENTTEVYLALRELIQSVGSQAALFDDDYSASMIRSLAKLLDSAPEFTLKILTAVSHLLVYLDPARLSPHDLTTTLRVFVNLLKRALPLTPELKNVLRRIVANTLKRKDSFTPVDIPILICSVVTLIKRAPASAPTLKTAAIKLLEQIVTKRYRFCSQDVIELWCSQAKLVRHYPALKPKLEKSALALLAQTEWLRFQISQLPPMFRVLSTLVRRGLLQAPHLATMVARELTVINDNKMSFGRRDVVDLFKAMSTLVKHGLPLTPDLKVTIFELLTPVNELRDDFTEQDIIKLLKSLNKLADNALQLTQRHRQTVTALLPVLGFHLQADDADGLLWPLAKLVSKGVEVTPTMEQGIRRVLSAADHHLTDLQPKQIVRIIWASASLLGQGLPLTPILKKVIVALVPRLDAPRANCSSSDVATLLWALGSLGELIECPPAVLDGLARELSSHSKLTREELYAALWGLLACAARCVDAASRETVQVTLYRLFVRVQAEPPISHLEASTMAMAAFWLDLQAPITPSYQPTISQQQSELYTQIRTAFPELRIGQKVSINQLPPVDLCLPDQATIIEVQSSHHFVGRDFSTRNGSCLLKTRLYQKLGYEVIEFPASKFDGGQQKWLEHLSPALKDKLSARVKKQF